MIGPLPAAPRRAALVFVDQTECRALRHLKRGFRHCFTVLECGSGWLVCDPLKDRIELSVLELRPGLDLPGFYASQGHRVLLGQAQPAPARRRLAVAPLTCVEVAKRLLGLHAPLVLTPWQLFRHLQRARTEAPCWRMVAAPCAAPAADLRLTNADDRTINLHINGRTTSLAAPIRRPDPAP